MLNGVNPEKNDNKANSILPCAFYDSLQIKSFKKGILPFKPHTYCHMTLVFL